MNQKGIKIYILSVLLSATASTLLLNEVAVASKNIHNESNVECAPEDITSINNTNESDNKPEQVATGPCSGTGIPVGTGTNAGIGGMGRGQNTTSGGTGAGPNAGAGQGAGPGPNAGFGQGAGTGPIRSQDRIHQP